MVVEERRGELDGPVPVPVFAGGTSIGRGSRRNVMSY
jgi:hypothetical protein